VLEVLSRSTEALALSDLARRLGVSKATVARVVAELVASGYVTRLPGGRTYAADYGVVALAGDVLQRHVLRRRAAPHLHRLAARTRLVCFLGVVWRQQTIILDRATPHLLHEHVMDVGKRAPMHGSSIAKASLAFLPEEHILAALEGFEFTPITPNTITSRGAFLAELALARRRGYATSQAEQNDWARSVAAPVFDAHGLPVGAIAAADWEPTEMPPERFERVVEDTRETALAVSHAIGYAGAVAPDVPARAGAVPSRPHPQPAVSASRRDHAWHGDSRDAR
jgi:DNA-binding IclR family transcriptional regulator